MLFVLGFAASAFAIHAEIPSETQAIVAKGDTQLTIGGSVRTRGEYNKMVFDPNADLTSKSYYDQRFRLHIDAQVGPNVSGRIHFESGNQSSDLYNWGRKQGGAKGVYQYGNTKQDDVTVLESWLQWKGDMFGVKVGHMPLALGNKLFFDHTKFGDDAIVVFASPAKGFEIAGLTAKFDEGMGSNSLDQDAYVLLGAYKGETFNVSGDATLVNANAGSLFGTALGGETQLYNIGVRGDVKVGPATIRGDVEFQTGTLCKDCPTEFDAKGYAALVGVDFALGGVKLTVEGAMGSGDDDPTDDEIGLFVTSLGADLHYSYIYDYRLPQHAAGTGQYSGIANTTYVKVGASGDITKDLAWQAALFYLTATEDVALGGATDALGNPKEEGELGFEVDAKLTYKIAKNLIYWVEGGYMALGDAYRVPASSGIPGDNEDPDDVWDLRHGIQLSF